MPVVSVGWHESLTFNGSRCVAKGSWPSCWCLSWLDEAPCSSAALSHHHNNNGHTPTRNANNSPDCLRLSWLEEPPSSSVI